MGSIFRTEKKRKPKAALHSCTAGEDVHVLGKQARLLNKMLCLPDARLPGDVSRAAQVLASKSKSVNLQQQQYQRQLL